MLLLPQARARVFVRRDVCPCDRVTRLFQPAPLSQQTTSFRGAIHPVKCTHVGEGGHEWTQKQRCVHP